MRPNSNSLTAFQGIGNFVSRPLGNSNFPDSAIFSQWPHLSRYCEATYTVKIKCLLFEKAPRADFRQMVGIKYEKLLFFTRNHFIYSLSP
jgi:hypothetical protein